MILMKTLASFFFKCGKTENMPEFEFERFQSIIFGRLYHTCNIYIVTTVASKKLSDLQEFHIRHRHLTIQVKHSYISKSVCVLFHWKLFWKSYFNMNLQQGSSLNRTPFKNEIKGIKTGASSINILNNLFLLLLWKNLVSCAFVKNVQRNC